MTSIQGRKQRRELFSAPMHVRSRQMRVHVSKRLREKLGITRRALLIHKGDKVRILKGDDYGKEGAVMEVDLSNRILYIEGAVAKNAKGVERLRAIRAANIEIIDGDFSTKSRKEILGRLKKAQAKPAAKAGN